MTQKSLLKTQHPLQNALERVLSLYILLLDQPLLITYIYFLNNYQLHQN